MKIGLGTEKLSLLASSNESIQQALEQFITVSQDGILQEFDNRADATLIAILLTEAKNSK